MINVTNAYRDTSLDGHRDQTLYTDYLYMLES